MDSCFPNSDFINMSLKRRKEILEKTDFLRLEELYRSQGKVFGKILLNQMSPIAKIILKADKDHKMPDQNSYVAPIDRLLQIQTGRVPCVVNAYYTELLKATTFDSIIHEGAKLESKLKEKEKLKVQEAIKNNSEFERFEANLKLRYALNEQKEINNKKFERFRQKIKQKFKEKIVEFEKNYDKKYNKMMKEVIEDCDEKSKFLRLKMQREKDVFVKINNIKKEKSTLKISKIEQVDKEVSADLVSDAIRKYEEKRFKEQHSKDIEKMTTILNFVGTVQNEQREICQKIKEAYMKTLKNLKDIINKINKCICSHKSLKNKNCLKLINTFKRNLEIGLNTINEFEFKYNTNLYDFIVKPLCTFVVPVEISNKFLCQCNLSSSDTDFENNCEYKGVPTVSKVVSLLTTKEKSSIFNLNKLDCLSEQQSSCTNATVFKNFKQKFINDIDIISVINCIMDSRLRMLLENDQVNYLNMEYIRNIIFEAITDHIYHIISNYDFTPIQRCVAEYKQINEESKFEGINDSLTNLYNFKKTHYFFDYENLKNLPKYLVNEHGNKAYIYKELTRDELIEIYKT